jgi:predicted Ser/Thr protein kinase
MQRRDSPIEIHGMDQQIQRLVEKTWKQYQELPASKRLLIAISGIPGSGKETLKHHETEEE